MLGVSGDERANRGGGGDGAMKPMHKWLLPGRP